VLWIRIRNNPNVLAGSESEKKDSDTVVGWKFLWKIKNQTLERENSYVFLLKICFSDEQVSEHIWKQLEAPFRKIWGQNISLRIRIRKKGVRIHNTGYQYWCGVGRSGTVPVPFSWSSKLYSKSNTSEFQTIDMMRWTFYLPVPVRYIYNNYRF
jgi:hypothetical protein